MSIELISFPPEDRSPRHRSVDQKKETSLLTRIQKVPNGCFAVFDDERSTRMATDAFSATTQSLTLAGSATAQFVPYINLVGFIFYFKHAYKIATDRIKLMEDSFRNHQRWDALFWGGQAMDAIGTAFNTVTKPLAGGIDIAGLSKITAIGVIFVILIPIILITFGAIGVLSHGWATARVSKEKHKFSKQKKESLHSLEALEVLLKRYIEKGSKVDQANFDKSHYATEVGKIYLEARISQLLPQIIELNELLIRVEDGNTSSFEVLDETLRLYDTMTGLQDDPKLREGRKELEDLKARLLKEGGELVGSAESEMNRVLCHHILRVLAASFTFIAGILFVLHGPYARIASILALTSSALDMTLIISEKIIAYQQSSKIKDLNLIPPPPDPASLE